VLGNILLISVWKGFKMLSRTGILNISWDSLYGNEKNITVLWVVTSYNVVGAYQVSEKHPVLISG
jgi:hypothetical protein